MTGSGTFVRGCWVRRQVLLPYAAVTTLTTGVLIASLGLTTTTVALRLCLALLVLGVTGLPGLGAELAEARRRETGIAGVRGLRGLALLRLVVPEPLLALFLGAVAGAALGVGVAHWVAGRGTPTEHLAWTWSDSTLLGAVLVMLLAGVVVGSRALLRQPLFEQISPVLRRLPPSRATTFLALLALVGLALAGYRSRQDLGAQDDWLVAAGPALGGLVAGGFAVLALGAVGALGRLVRGSRLSTWLAVRALTGGRDRRRAVVLGVAGASVALFAISAGSAVSSWVHQTARLTNGAALRVPVDLSAVGALQLTHRVDPEGRWLAAAQVTSDSTDPSHRQALVDTSRLVRVLGPALDGTGADRLADVGARLRRGPAVAIGPAGSRTSTVRVRGRVLSGNGRGHVVVAVNYIDGSGTLSTSEGVLTSRTGNLAGEIRLEDCRSGCAPNSINLQPDRHLRGATVQLDTIRLGAVSLLPLPWQVDTGDGGATSGADAERDPAGRLLLALDTDVAVLHLDQAPLDVVVTPTVHFASDTTLPGTGGAQRTPHVVAQVPALPFVGGGGVLGDLARGALGGSSTPPGSNVYVLARGDTPDRVLRQVPASGAARHIGDAEVTLRHDVRAGQAGLYVVAGLAGLLAAVLHIIAVAARTRAARRRERRDLGRVGVSAAVRRRAHWQELTAVATVVVVLAVAGWVVTWWLFGDTLALVRLPVNGLPLREDLW